MYKILLALVITLWGASLAEAQNCGKLVPNPITGRMDCLGTAAAGYTATVTAVTGITVTAATHGQGTKPLGECWDNSTPRNKIVQTSGFPTVAANGDMVFAWTGTKTGYCLISALGNQIGPQGPAGANGSNGTNGTNGTNGADGAAGADGCTVIYGTAAPSTEGKNCDFYIRTSTNYIYGPKASGTWPSGTSLVGADGTNGAGFGSPGCTLDTSDPSNPYITCGTNIRVSGQCKDPSTVPTPASGNTEWFCDSTNSSIPSYKDSDGNVHTMGSSSLAWSSPPVDYNSTGSDGQIAKDATYFYAFVTERWQRIAWDSGWGTGGVAIPTFDNDTGTYDNDVTVTVSDATPSAHTCTTSGTSPSTPTAPTPGTCTVGTTDVSPITIVKTGDQIKSLGTKSALTNSSVKTATYTLKVATPTSSVNSGAGLPQTVSSCSGCITLSTATTSGIIHYNTTGPTASCSDTTYSGALSAGSTTTFYWVGCKSDYVTSDQGSGTLTIAAPSVVVTGRAWGTASTGTSSLSASSCSGSSCSGGTLNISAHDLIYVTTIIGAGGCYTSNPSVTISDGGTNTFTEIGSGITEGGFWGPPCMRTFRADAVAHSGATISAAFGNSAFSYYSIGVVVIRKTPTPTSWTFVGNSAVDGLNASTATTGSLGNAIDGDVILSSVAKDVAHAAGANAQVGTCGNVSCSDVGSDLHTIFGGGSAIDSLIQWGLQTGSTTGATASGNASATSGMIISGLLARPN